MSAFPESGYRKLTFVHAVRSTSKVRALTVGKHVMCITDLSVGAVTGRQLKELKRKRPLDS